MKAIGPIDLTCEEFREYRIQGVLKRIDKPVSLCGIIGSDEVEITDSEGRIHKVPPRLLVRCLLKDKTGFQTG
jgi:hypothetical protein